MAQLSVPDMRLPLQYCLTYPNRAPSLVRPLDIARTRELGFHPIDQTKFRCFGLAYQALAMGGAAPCCLNAANQVAVEAFLDGRIAFGTISGIIETTLSEHSRRPALARPGIKHLLAVESWAARFAHSLVNQQRKPVR
jgi:1-deoxy-D-xylulose-5-phosphate reductoisomerase